MSDKPTIIIVPVGPRTEYVSHSRIRDLWAGNLAETGNCPSCDEPLGEPHAQPCKWKGLVGSNEAEHYL